MLRQRPKISRYSFLLATVDDVIMRTCHWCHVMAKESFEDQESAKILNDYFVAVKVDKEERPDIDAVYMAVCQSLTGSGGWPLTIIMTPEQIPFFAATYIPKTTKYNSVGLMELSAAVNNQWLNNRSEFLVSADKIYRHLLSQNKHQNLAGEPTTETLYLGIHQLKESYDSEYGGFHIAPKFPMAHDLLFLLEYGSIKEDYGATGMAEKTLQQMYRGGIYDHIGGGFSRYSTDRQWLIPHFEKMLYDNALLIIAYAEAYQLTGKMLYRRIAEQIIAYAVRELCDEAGGFYCGQDADSDGEEGKYYALSIDEVMEQLGTDGSKFCDWFGFTKEGNFEGKNIPNLIRNKRYEEVPEQFEELIQQIYEYRKKRVSLHTDDKILVSWNAMMVAALAKSARAFEKTEYLKLAKDTCKFIEKHLKNASGRLQKRWRSNEAAGSAQLDDYAYYTWALIEVYETCGEVDYLEQAVHCGAEMVALFWDEENDGFFLYAHDAEQLIIRPKEFYDGAIPSGNSIAAFVLHKLSRLTAENMWREYAQRQLSFMAGQMGEYPMNCCFALRVFLRTLLCSTELICTAEEITDMSAVREFIKEQRLVNVTLIIKTKKQMERLNKVVPFTSGYPIPEQGTAYYVCENDSCRPPVFRD